MERVTALLHAPGELQSTALGPLWRLSEQLLFVRENVDPALLAIDCAAHSGAQGLWGRFVEREADVCRALGGSSAALAGRMRRNELPPRAFRSSWQDLGFAPHEGESGTPADDYLNGLLRVARYTSGELSPDGGSPNMATRAERVADFLDVLTPAEDDVVFDLGSGSGKLALTVCASAHTRVVGVEYGRRYVEAARATADQLALTNVQFLHADVRDSDLSSGSIFYLYYPFNGPVARTVAQTLGALARTKPIAIYAAGPLGGFADHFLAEVASGALRLCERRGAFGEVLVLRSAGFTRTDGA